MRRAQHPRTAVRPLQVRRVIALAGHRAVQLPDARRIPDRSIEMHQRRRWIGRLVKAVRDGQQHALDKLPARVVSLQVDAIEQVPTVAAVRPQRLRPAEIGQEGGDFSGSRQARRVLGIAGRNSCWPLSVKVEWQPEAPRHVGVRGRMFRVVLEPVHCAGQERAFDRIQGDVDAWRLAVELRCYVAGAPLRIIVVARYRATAGHLGCANLPDRLVCRVQRGERGRDGISHFRGERASCGHETIPQSASASAASHT
jgi:hypothetical protein